jgi:exopolysaccharide biosynthesis polyprenyl glycosylphosphotransferase
MAETILADTAVATEEARDMSATTLHAASAYLNGPVKRLVDAVGSLALIILLAPLLLTIMALVRLDSPGGAFYRQMRYGRDGKPFQILKFRSMAQTAPGAGFVQATRGDPRITRIGRFIRRTSLDELPQLFNVLRGDMSLVGPRPHPMPLDDEHAALIPGFMQRYAARPGITGLAQVSGSRGATPTVEHMARRIGFDLRYAREASLLLDLRILLATVREVFASSEAF